MAEPSRCPGGPTSRVKWTYEQEERYLWLLLEGIASGKRVNGQWGKRGYEWLIDGMRQFGFNFSYDKLKNKYDTMRDEYSSWKKLLGRGVDRVTGTGFDWSMDIMVASEEWWASRIALYPNLKHYRRKPLTFTRFDSYRQIFDPVMASGDGVINTYSSQASASPVDPLASDDDPLTPRYDRQQESAEDDDTPVGGGSNDGSKRSSDEAGLSTGPSGRRHKRSMTVAEGIRDEMRALRLHFQSRDANAVETPPISTCMRMLRSLPGVQPGDGFFMYASQLLRDPGHRTMFMEMDTAEMKIAYIQSVNMNNEPPNRWFRSPSPPPTAPSQ